MSGSGDLVNFDLIETQKENIQSLPSGRSARALVAAFSPLSDRHRSPFSPDSTNSINDAVRHEFEQELQAINESDDPLDIYDRYVKWNLYAYPSAQATPQSGLLPLLERATKAFLPSTHYRNDPRYLRLWLHYINLFSDSPRETFAFLSRHGIGEGLALFYEEFAAWLEGAGRYTQAEEVYKLGLQKEARPTERLLRKFGAFQSRMEQQPRDSNGPSSPALPTVRPALAAKVDPFGTTGRSASDDPQEGSSTRGAGSGAKTRSGKPKMAIFNDGDAEPSSVAPASKGWDTIGSMQERKKENTIEPRPWAGETLKAGKKPNATQKMAIFRDPNLLLNEQKEPISIPNISHTQKERINARTGKAERVFVNLAAIYPDPKNPTYEMSLEELRALSRGWMNKDWSKQKKIALKETSSNKYKQPVTRVNGKVPSNKLEPTGAPVTEECQLDKENHRAVEMCQDVKEEKPRKLKVREIKGETQTVKMKFDSPTGPKIKRRNTSEPTMTLHTRAAIDEIYSIFNQPLKAELKAGEDSEYDSDCEEDGYVSAGESIATGRMSSGNSEFGDDETSAFGQTQLVNTEAPSIDPTKTEISEWTEFNPAQHIPIHSGREIQGSGNISQHSESDGNFSSSLIEFIPDEEQKGGDHSAAQGDMDENRFVPLEPEDYNPPTGPYRDPYMAAQSRLPFMTPILEKTESSLASTLFRERGALSFKTPCQAGRSFIPSATPAIPEIDDLLLGSPFQDYTQVNEFEYTQDIDSPSKIKSFPPKSSPFKRSGPVIITDPQCNPMDNMVQQKILRSVRPALHTYLGYHDHKLEMGSNAGEIRKYFKNTTRGTKNNGDEPPEVPPVLCFSGAARSYEVKRQLGEGGFAPVYLVESLDSPDTFTDSEDDSESPDTSPQTPSPRAKGLKVKPTRNIERGLFEAIKVETDPPSAWEFYVLRTVHSRLNGSTAYKRAKDSIVQAHELHHFKDEAILIEEYRNQGTLIDLVNMGVQNNVGQDPGLSEIVVMFFAIELFRTVEALHASGVIHGDLKADNCLVRLEEVSNIPFTNANPDGLDYCPSGTYGWEKKGLMLIDFGRAIDMHVFNPTVQFIADWKIAEHECSEMRECRPWTYQVDLYGLAGVIYVMLFGKYMEVVSNADNAKSCRPGFASGRNFRIKESLKRYWEREIWSDVFDLCLNPASEKWTNVEQQCSMSKENVNLDSNLALSSSSLAGPLIHSMQLVRQRMEAWLMANAGRKGLQGQLHKLEVLVARRRARLGLEKD
ncbi:protein kinase [Ophidiomyces ophidiicola]|nr:protein kinase [Ophidiomyces ophidiicola]KAI1981511.1 protein kinase [Ophidiomyces ophidiicola]KAI1981732.1 protein kinase [Ophidiomyces ophidiicola]KAI1991061.1 protein kinase [Ophidiomyces ophidiicola]